MSENKHRALENLTVLDFSRVLAGPFCSMLLADMGAKVIKVERPDSGDDTRAWPPFMINKDGKKESMYYNNVNRNKLGITVDMKSEEGKQLLLEMVKKSDIVLENFRPGVMDRLGLGYDVLKEVNPRIIYAAISGFGCYGPYSKRPGYDILGQAMGGMMSVTGNPGGEPLRAGVSIADQVAGLNATIGILAAVNARTITGKGQRVDIALMDGMVGMMENMAVRYMCTGKLPPLVGNNNLSVAPYGMLKCKDGYMILAVGNQKQYERICLEILDRPDMVTDPRFLDMATRIENQDAIMEVITDRIKDLTPAEATDLFLASGIPAGPVLNIKEILEDPHVAAREMFAEVEHPTLGRIKINGNAVKLMDTKPEVRTAAPLLGQHNKKVFTSMMGMSEAQVEDLLARGVL